MRIPDVNMISVKVFNRLSESQQAAIMKAGEEATAFLSVARAEGGVPEGATAEELGVTTGVLVATMIFSPALALIGLRDVRDDRVHRDGRRRLGSASPFNIKVESIKLRDFNAEEVARL